MDNEVKHQMIYWEEQHTSRALASRISLPISIWSTRDKESSQGVLYSLGKPVQAPLCMWRTGSCSI